MPSASNSRAANTHRRGLAIVVAAVSCAMVIAACGSSGPSQRGSGGTAKGELVAASLDYSKCMRQHGVTGFPDRTLSPPANQAEHNAVVGRDGVVFAIPRSIGTRSPPFKQAATACKLPPRQVTHLAPFGPPASLSPPEKREVEDEEHAEPDD